jgi:uncharacterized DUF497 family protein
VKKIKWNEEKNAWLKKIRGISFEKIIEDIKNGHLIAKRDHPNQSKYPGQKIFIVNHENYCYIVPFVESEQEYFFKTIIPSREAAKKYLKKGE